MKWEKIAETEKKKKLNLNYKTKEADKETWQAE